MVGRIAFFIVSFHTVAFTFHSGFSSPAWQKKTSRVKTFLRKHFVSLEFFSISTCFLQEQLDSMLANGDWQAQPQRDPGLANIRSSYVFFGLLCRTVVRLQGCQVSHLLCFVCVALSCSSTDAVISWMWCTYLEIARFDASSLVCVALGCFWNETIFILIFHTVAFKHAVSLAEHGFL